MVQSPYSPVAMQACGESDPVVNIQVWARQMAGISKQIRSAFMFKLYYGDKNQHINTEIDAILKKKINIS
jgi:hypothetical protein